MSGGSILFTCSGTIGDDGGNLAVNGSCPGASGDPKLVNSTFPGLRGIVYKLVVARRLNIVAVGNNLDITWEAAGGQLQTKTNDLSGAWFNVPNTTGTNHVVVPLDQSDTSVFYRLIFP